MTNKYKTALFGFDKDDKSHIGYIHVTKDGQFEILDNEEDATWYSYDVGKKACEYVKDEECLSNWKFHLVKRKTS